MIMPKSVQCFLAALAASILGSFVVGTVTLIEWLEPTTPALILLAASLLPAILAGLMTVSPADQQPWTRKLILTGAAPGIIIGLLTVGLGLMWTQPQFRANVASKISADFQNSQPLLQALQEPFPEVALAACKVLAASNFPHDYRLAFDRLSAAPQVASQCLQDSNLANTEVLLNLAEVWHQKLIAGTSNAQSTCEASDVLGSLTTKPELQTARLMHCALSALDPDAQQCCTQTLTTRYPTADELASPLQEAHPHLAVLKTSTRLLEASFSGRPKLGELSLQTPAFQKTALLTACSELESNPTPTLNALYQLTQSLECLEGGQTPPNALNTWTQTCQALTNHFEIQPKAEPPHVFCNVLNKELERQAILAAQIEQEIRNIPRQDAEELIAQIESGAELTRPEDLQKYLRDLGVADADEYSDDEIAPLKAYFDQMNSVEDPEEPMAELTPAHVEALKTGLPDTLRHIEASGASKAQIDALKTLQDSFNQIPNMKLPTKK